MYGEEFSDDMTQSGKHFFTGKCLLVSSVLHLINIGFINPSIVHACMHSIANL